MYQNKTIILSGATKGIGRAIAFELIHQGANLALVARTESDLLQLKSELQELAPNRAIHHFPTDVTDHQAVMASVNAILEKFKNIDGLISNAGYSHPQYFEKTPIEEFHKQMQTNFFGAVHFTKAVLPHLKSKNFIAYTSSVLGYMGCFGYTSYAPSKFAIVGFAESLRQELVETGIQISVLCPPDTLTPGYEIENLTKPIETRMFSESIKVMSPEDVAKIFLKKLEKGYFLINCNLDSIWVYRLKLLMPETFQRISLFLLKRIRSKVKLN